MIPQLTQAACSLYALAKSQQHNPATTEEQHNSAARTVDQFNMAVVQIGAALIGGNVRR